MPKHRRRPAVSRFDDLSAHFGPEGAAEILGIPLDGKLLARRAANRTRNIPTTVAIGRLVMDPHILALQKLANQYDTVAAAAGLRQRRLQYVPAVCYTKAYTPAEADNDLANLKRLDEFNTIREFCEHEVIATGSVIRMGGAHSVRISYLLNGNVEIGDKLRKERAFVEQLGRSNPRPNQVDDLSPVRIPLLWAKGNHDQINSFLANAKKLIPDTPEAPIRLSQLALVLADAPSAHEPSRD